MSKKTKIADLPEFDITEHLKSDEDIASYLTMVIEESKYPPAKPGALDCEPLKAANRGR
jgi:DNA-binding phage protein